MARMIGLTLLVFAIGAAYVAASCAEHQRCLSKDIVIDAPSSGPVIVIRSGDCP